MWPLWSLGCAEWPCNRPRPVERAEPVGPKPRPGPCARTCQQPGLLTARATQGLPSRARLRLPTLCWSRGRVTGVVGPQVVPVSLRHVGWRASGSQGCPPCFLHSAVLLPGSLGWFWVSPAGPSTMAGVGRLGPGPGPVQVPQNPRQAVGLTVPVGQLWLGLPDGWERHEAECSRRHSNVTEPRAAGCPGDSPPGT